MCKAIEHAPRTPWDSDFPDVVNLTTVAERDKIEAYTRAKYAKNSNQAKKLMAELKHTKAFRNAIKTLKKIAGDDDVILVPVQSLEKVYDPRNRKTAISSNPLPMAIAMAISDETGWEIDTEIVQANIVGHTAANTIERFSHPAMFQGEVKKGKKYIGLDDHVGFGGTIASLKGWIESNGGDVIAISSLTANRMSRCLRLADSGHKKLFGEKNFDSIGCHAGSFERIFGYPLECSTNAEAQQISIVVQERQKKNPSYNLQNFLEEVIQNRKMDLTNSQLLSNKAELTKQKKDGTFIPMNVHISDKNKYASGARV